jgi:hypothetical protein
MGFTNLFFNRPPGGIVSSGGKLLSQLAAFLLTMAALIDLSVSFSHNSVSSPLVIMTVKSDLTKRQL